MRCPIVAVHTMSEWREQLGDLKAEMMGRGGTYCNTRRRILTEDKVYLHFDRGKPKFLVVADSPELHKLGWRDLDPLGVIFVDTSKLIYETFHALLHSMLGNTCRERHVTSGYRTKEGSAYGRLIRYGDGDEGAPHGCFDLPLFDVDAVEVDDRDNVVALVELKHRGERTTYAQRTVINACRRLGVGYIEDINERE